MPYNPGMNWLVLALLTAVFQALGDAVSKKALADVDVFALTWFRFTLALVVLVPAVVMTGAPDLGPWFWPALIADGALNILAVTWYMTAISRSDLSLVLPMLTFTPVFLLVTSPLIVGEFPDGQGVAGIGLIFAGSYILNLGLARDRLAEPLKALFRDKGTRLMLGVAFIWSLTSNIDKIGVDNSSSQFWPFSVLCFMAVGLYPMMAFRSKSPVAELRKNARWAIPAGLFTGFLLLCQMAAIKLTLVAYVISVKRLSIVLGMFLGWAFFREKKIGPRLAGAGLMLAGFMLITLP